VYDTQSGIASLHFPDDKQVLLKIVLLEPVGTNQNSILAKEVGYGDCALITSEMLSWLTCHNHQISDRVESCAAGLGSIVVRTERRNARHYWRNSDNLDWLRKAFSCGSWSNSRGSGRRESGCRSSCWWRHGRFHICRTECTNDL